MKTLHFWPSSKSKVKKLLIKWAIWTKKLMNSATPLIWNITKVHFLSNSSWRRMVWETTKNSWVLIPKMFSREDSNNSHKLPKMNMSKINCQFSRPLKTTSMEIWLIHDWFKLWLIEVMKLLAISQRNMVSNGKTLLSENVW